MPNHETTINTPCSHDIKHKAQQLANADRRSVSAWVRNMIEREWEKTNKTKKETI
jgi:predicted transcriptional regulator